MNNNARYAAYLLHTYKDVLSDTDFKDISGSCDAKELAKAIMERNTDFNEWDARHLHSVVGGLDEGEWNDELLKKYAENVYNYEYTYKPEAQQVDPSIDPNEQHIGPMAQDLEKVNPATVITDEHGIKSVDTGRLALMNAGAIASLAREIAELKHE